MHFIIRSVDFRDREGLLDLRRQFPLCSLPDNKSELDKKIQTSKESFSQSLPKEKRNYIFVLEDKKEKKVIGSSQILSYFGPKRTLCYFLKETKRNPCLQLARIKKGLSQIGGLILHKDYRKSSDFLGLQISAVRFLYIQTFPKEFSPVIEVSLTAPFKGKANHFWTETGSKHLKMSYYSALKNLQKDRVRFLSLFPKNLKIFLNQISPEAKSCMNQVHPQTFPVYKGLLKRGFSKAKRYHIIDGGIYLEAPWKTLSFSKKAKKHHLKKEKGLKGSSFLLSQQTEQGFFCARIQGKATKQILQSSSFPKEFEEGEKSLALPFPL